MNHNFVVDIDLLPTPSIILQDIKIIKNNSEFLKLPPEGSDNLKGSDLTHIGLFREDSNFVDFINKIKSREDVNDFLLHLWNGTIVFATTRNFQRENNFYTLVSFSRFALSHSEEAGVLFGRYEYLQDIIDKFEFLISIHDKNLNFVLCNKNFEKFFDLTRDEIIGKNIKSIFGDNEISRLQVETDLELFQGKKQQIHLHLNLQSKDGKFHYLEVNKFLFNFGGEDFVFCITIDSSELDYVRQLYRESSTLYRALIENAFDAIYLLEGRKYKYVNPRFCELTGYTFEELTSPDFDFDVLIPEESKKFLEERYRARLEGKEIPNQYELQLLHKSRSRVFVEVSTVSVGKPGEVLVMGIMRDITQRKLYEQQLKESEEKLKQ
ncbi:MAG: PAS domain-containing protein, partial [Candidatus Kapaibacteriota bacterium]